MGKMKKSKPKKDEKLRCGCGSEDLLPETLGGMAVYREVDKGTRIYRVKCMTCGMTGEMELNSLFPDVISRRRW